MDLNVAQGSALIPGAGCYAFCAGDRTLTRVEGSYLYRQATHHRAAPEGLPPVYYAAFFTLTQALSGSGAVRIRPPGLQARECFSGIHDSGW